MRSSLRYVAALVSTNIKDTLALRGAFWLQAVLMAANDVLFFCVWWLFFARFPDVRGWTLNDMYAAYGFVAFAFGLYAVLAGGTRDLAQRIVTGELDALLPQPRALLPRLALSRSSASGWGDIVFGLVLLGLASQLGAARLPALLLLAACAALVMALSSILFNSLAFWAGELDGLPRQMIEFTILFSTYPSPLFTGTLRLALFTLLPAGLIGYLPAEYLREPSARLLLSAVGGTLVYGVVVVWIFGRGLRRYESGNRLTVNG